MSDVMERIEACTRLEQLFDLAWEELGPKGAVDVCLGMALVVEGPSDYRELFWPDPHRFETLARWVGSDDTFARTTRQVRGFTLAAVPAALIAYVIQSVAFTGEWTGLRQVGYLLMILALDAALSFVVRWMLAVVVRRRAARLDDESARVMLRDALVVGGTKKAPLVAGLVKIMQRHVREAVQRASPPTA